MSEKITLPKEELINSIIERTSSTSNIVEDLDNFVKDINPIKRYGVRINKNEPNPYNRVEYIYDAVGMKPAHMNFTTGKFDYGDWDSLWFITGNYPVLLYTSGYPYTYPDPDNYKISINGTAIDYDALLSVEGTAGLNLFSRIPLTYVCMYEDDIYEYVIVSDRQYDENYIPIAHMDYNGNVVNEIFIACCESQVLNERCVSKVGGYPSSGETAFYVHETCTKANGDAYNMMTWSQRQLINALLLIMGKSEDSQAVYGNGRLTGRDETVDGYGFLECGSLYDKGQFYGSNSYDEAMKVFHIENYCGHVSEFVQGLVAKNTSYFCSLHGPYSSYDDTDEANERLKKYVELSYVPDVSDLTNHYITSHITNKFGRFPRFVSSPVGSTSTYATDWLFSIKNNMNTTFVLRLGGLMATNEQDDTYKQTLGMNWFAININRLYTSKYIGSRLSYIPQSS